MQRYRDWLTHKGPRPVPLPPAPLSIRLQRIESLVSQEQRSSRRSQLKRRGWNRRLLLWQQGYFHWLAWEQMMAELPEAVLRRAELVESSVEAMANELRSGVLGSQAPASLKQWHTTTQREQLPLFAMLALAQEQQPLHGSFGPGQECAVLITRRDLRMAFTAGLGNGFSYLSGIPFGYYVPLAVFATAGGTYGASLELGRQRILARSSVEPCSTSPFGGSKTFPWLWPLPSPWGP